MTHRSAPSQRLTCSLAILVSGFGFFASPSECEAQYRRWYRPRVGVGVGWGAGWGVGGNFASTAAEGYQRGYADVVRARGEATEAATRSAINYEEARGKYIENQAKWTETYLHRKRLAQAELTKEREEARAKTNNYRALNRRRRGAPQKLSASQLDPLTGEVKWPSALKEPGFAKQRDELEKLLALRATTGLSPDDMETVYNTAKAMQRELKKQIRKLPTNAYLSARKFLDSLIHIGRTG